MRYTHLMLTGLTIASVLLLAGCATANGDAAGGGRTILEGLGPDGENGWLFEGDGAAEFAADSVALRDTQRGVVLWYREDLPADLRLSFDLAFNNNRGIGVFFLAARGSDGGDIIADLPARTGNYGEYIRGRIDCYGVSMHRYFPDGRHNPGSNIRRNSGFHLVNHAAADPVLDAGRTYRVVIEKVGARLRLWVDDRLVHDWRDDGAHGPPLGAGKAGFRLRGHPSCVMTVANVAVEAL